MTQEGTKAEIKVWSVEAWIDAIQENRLVLPMIQRGSVWKPHQILDLWDTLLQGMPPGALMASPVGSETKVLDLRTRKMVLPPPNAIALLDGQQRTLAMLGGWPGFADMLQRHVAVWVDLGEPPQGEYKFRLWATTGTQPFGYERASEGGQALAKLSAADRRYANSVYDKTQDERLDVLALWNSDGFMPWRAKFALRLSDLILDPKGLQSVEQLLSRKVVAVEHLLERLRRAELARDQETGGGEHVKRLEARLSSLKAFGESGLIGEVQERAQALHEALLRLRTINFPVIPVGEFMEAVASTEGDPPVAVLFKRVGTGGQPLSDQDYVFAMLKHHEPEVHVLVEELLSGKPECGWIPALYTANDLVSTAVRMQLRQLRHEEGAAHSNGDFRDEARISKSRFARLVRKHGTTGPGEGSKFAREFRRLIAPDGAFVKALQASLGAIAYSERFPQGLPQHAVPWLVDRFLFDVLVAWGLAEGSDPQACRLQLVRFLLWGFLCIDDKPRASELCIQNLSRLQAGAAFPDKDLVRLLIKEGLANPAPSPQAISDAPDLAFRRATTGDKVLWGVGRFQERPGLDPHICETYRRWWNHRGDRHEHPFLLWLQRDFVHKEFERQRALAGMEDETPYDFDHILPRSNWSGWQGIRSSDRLIDFATDVRRDHNVIGNAIGNLRVWPSRLNRQDGDASPVEKLQLQSCSDGGLTNERCVTSRVGEDQIGFWRAASANDATLTSSWSAERARAFQQAVELRTYTLYKNFYDALEIRSLDSVFRDALAERVR